MIALFSETDFKIQNETIWKNWIHAAVESEGFTIQEVNYIFCDDEYLLQINIDHLQHDYYTDVIGFQLSEGKALSGDIFISIDRVRDNAKTQKVSFEKELARVMIHGVLHFMNYQDHSAEEATTMRKAEDKYLALFTNIN